MKTRTRLTLWFSGILFIALIAMGVLSYYEFKVEPATQSQAADSNLTSEEESDFTQVVSILVWCGVPALLISLVGGWWMVRQALAPVEAITFATERINESNLGYRLAHRGKGDEFDRLMDLFNAMTARLEQSFRRIREFTLHASHELKTPLTIMHGELENTLEDQTLSSAQRERAKSQLDEVQRLAKIVDALTLLTKADAGLIQVDLKPMRIDELVRECFGDTQVLAHPSAITARLAACERLAVVGDAHRLRQLLLILADNAVKYNRSGGSVLMTLSRAGDGVELIIANTSAGVKPEDLPHVFERFYRGDRAHSSQVEGCGLGLSIAQWIVSAHRGTIRFESEPGKVTTVTVRLPVVKEVAADEPGTPSEPRRADDCIPATGVHQTDGRRKNRSG